MRCPDMPENKRKTGSFSDDEPEFSVSLKPGRI
jgi:hypothetical protein